MITGLYRAKGYGMGHRTGYLAGLSGGKRKAIPASGYVFPPDAKNAVCWKRWLRYLVIDRWGIFFPGCIVGMMAPCILVGYLASQPDSPPPDNASIMLYCPLQLGRRYGYLMFGSAVLTGFLLLYKAQMAILDLLARNLTDAMLASGARVHGWAGRDPRRLYYPVLVGLVAVIGVLIHMSPPVEVIIVSANLTNLAALIFPLATMYLNRRLPKPARIAWWSYLAPAANVVFFGFFFVNFVVFRFSGTPAGAIPMIGLSRSNISRTDAIRTRLALSFVLAVLLPIIGMGTVLAISVSQGIQARLPAQLESVAILKESAIRDWVGLLQREAGSGLRDETALGQTRDILRAPGVTTDHRCSNTFAAGWQPRPSMDCC